MRRWLAVAMLAAVVVLGLQWLAFVQAEEPAVAALPDRIKSETRAQGVRYLDSRDLPPFCVTALVDTEDRSFWTNRGIDPIGIARAVLTDLVTGSFQEGGSTLTQQLARDQLLSQEKTIRRKVKELLLALMINRRYDKRQILTMYVNQVYLGHGAVGFVRAAQVYFGVPATGLSEGQCALLAGLPQAPTRDDPLEHPSAARQRQKEVLASMVDAGDLTPKQAEAVYAQPLYLVPGNP